MSTLHLVIDGAYPVPKSILVILEVPNRRVVIRNQSVVYISLTPLSFPVYQVLGPFENMTYLDRTSEPLQQSSSTLTKHSTLIIILIVLSFCISFDLNASFRMGDKGIGLTDMIRYRCVISRRDD